MQVGNGYHQNALRILAVNHAVWKSSQSASSGLV